MICSLAACGGSTNGAAASESADSEKAVGTEEFNPDTEQDSMTIEEVREANGTEVKVENGTMLGAVEKSMSNEFWRTLETGYETAAAEVEKAGIKINIEVDGTTDESDETGQQTMTENMITQGE